MHQSTVNFPQHCYKIHCGVFQGRLIIKVMIDLIQDRQSKESKTSFVQSTIQVLKHLKVQVHEGTRYVLMFLTL